MNNYLFTKPTKFNAIYLVVNYFMKPHWDSMKKGGNIMDNLMNFFYLLTVFKD